jgi:hypothetical protein
MVTNRTSNSFKILWLTEKKVFGAVKIIETNDLISENFESNSHFLQINNLSPNTEYSFVIYSGTTEFAQSIKVRTLSYHESNSTNYSIFGQVFDKSGVKVQQMGLITLKFNDGFYTSELIGTTLNETGGFQFNMNNLVKEETGNLFSYNRKLDAEITVYPAGGEIPVIKKYTYDFSIQNQIPNIYLGDINIDVIPGVND